MARVPHFFCTKGFWVIQRSAKLVLIGIQKTFWRIQNFFGGYRNFFRDTEAFFAIQKTFLVDAENFFRDTENFFRDAKNFFGKQKDSADKNPKTSRKLQQYKIIFARKKVVLWPPGLADGPENSIRAFWRAQQTPRKFHEDASENRKRVKFPRGRKKKTTLPLLTFQNVCTAHPVVCAAFAAAFMFVPAAAAFAVSCCFC